MSDKRPQRVRMLTDLRIHASNVPHTARMESSIIAPAFRQGATYDILSIDDLHGTVRIRNARGQIMTVAWQFVEFIHE